MVINQRRFLALLEKHPGFGWLHETLAQIFREGITAGNEERYFFDDIDRANAFDVLQVLSLAEVVEIVGVDLYFSKGNFKMVTLYESWESGEWWVFSDDNCGFFEEKWKE